MISECAQKESWRCPAYVFQPTGDGCCASVGTNNSPALATTLGDSPGMARLIWLCKMNDLREMENREQKDRLESQRKQPAASTASALEYNMRYHLRLPDQPNTESSSTTGSSTVSNLIERLFELEASLLDGAFLTSWKATSGASSTRETWREDLRRSRTHKDLSVRLIQLEEAIDPKFLLWNVKICKQRCKKPRLSDMCCDSSSPVSSSSSTPTSSTTTQNNTASSSSFGNGDSFVYDTNSSAETKQQSSELQNDNHHHHYYHHNHHVPTANHAVAYHEQLLKRTHDSYDNEGKQNESQNLDEDCGGDDDLNNNKKTDKREMWLNGVKLWEYFSFGSNSNIMNSRYRTELNSLVIDLEVGISWDAVCEQWRLLRDKWLWNCKTGPINDLRSNLRELEWTILPNFMETNWPDIRPSWIRRLETSTQPYQLASCLFELFKNIKRNAYYGHFCPDQWLYSLSHNIVLLSESSDTTSNGLNHKWTVKHTVNNPHFSDISFLLDNGKSRVWALRNLLAEKNEFFRALLKGGMRESNQREIVFQEDISSSVMIPVLEYIYTGNVELLHLEVLTIAKIMALADMLLIESLREDCERSLLRKAAQWTPDETLSILYDCHHCTNNISLKQEVLQKAVVFRKDLKKRYRKPFENLVETIPELKQQIKQTHKCNEGDDDEEEIPKEQEEAEEQREDDQQQQASELQQMVEQA